MFSSLREKLHNVQEEITSSLKNLKIDRHGIRRKSAEANAVQASAGGASSNVNLQAGMELLEHYQRCWREMHNKTEESAAAAQGAAVIITGLHRTYDQQWEKMGQLSASLAIIPKLVHGVQEVSDLILNVQCAFDETEEALLQLENMIETIELREKELEHRFQLALYRKKREDELDDLKIKLTNEHFVKIKEYEKRKASEMKMRQAYFQEAFEKDLEQYKEGSLVTRVDAKADKVSTPTLEEIELEEDTRSARHLEAFLADGDAEEDEELPVIPIPQNSNNNSSVQSTARMVTG